MEEEIVLVLRKTNMSVRYLTLNLSSIISFFSFLFFPKLVRPPVIEYTEFFSL